MIAKKSFGQHFLQDKSVIKKIIVAAEIVPGETVLEIGPGHGILTQALVESGAHVIAVEADRDLIPGLKEKFGDSIELIQGDILQWTPPTDIKSYKLVSNLPYNIASAVLEKFLSSPGRGRMGGGPTRLVVMVQKEVADRMLAKPGDMSVLSVACQIYATIKRVCNVPPGAFRPMPKVDSTVVSLLPLTKGELEGDEEMGSGLGYGIFRTNLLLKKSHIPDLTPSEQVIALAKLGFASRRKQLQGNLGKKYGTEHVKVVLRDMGSSEKVRAQELSIDQWLMLAQKLKVIH